MARKNNSSKSIVFDCTVLEALGVFGKNEIKREYSSNYLSERGLLEASRKLVSLGICEEREERVHSERDYSITPRGREYIDSLLDDAVELSNRYRTIIYLTKREGINIVPLCPSDIKFRR